MEIIIDKINTKINNALIFLFILNLLLLFVDFLFIDNKDKLTFDKIIFVFILRDSVIKSEQ